ncbi:MAG: aminotransferase class III-fold pyridoxal phosphate-dependent enzyme, partial [Thermoplasmata archaeon]|nr:aminotransferase class III-fold pyridoxal phosphate-dependent enzyme [Thermoplasmata archaeon]
GEHMMKRLRELQGKHEVIGDVRGLGLMCAAEFVESAEDRRPNAKLRERVVEEGYKRGLLLLGCGKSTIRFIPPLVIRREEVDEGVEILDAAISAALRRG